MDLKNINKKLIIIFLLTCLVLLIVLNAVLSSLNSDNNKLINYRKDTGASLIERASVEYDRNIYYNCENFIKQYIDDFSNNSKLYENYYKYSLTKEYKSNISKMKYKKIAKSFYDKIVQYNTVQTTQGEQLKTTGSLYNSSMLSKIYKLGEDNYYLCVLKLNDETKLYFGLYFNMQNNKAYIFYIE